MAAPATNQGPSSGSELMQASMNRTKSFYSSMHSKLQQADPECNPEMLQAQHNEAVRSGRATKRSPSRMNYDKINTQQELPGALAGSKTGGYSNPDGWTNTMGGGRLPSNMAQSLWRRASDAKPGIDRQMSNIITQAQQQRAGVKETLDDLDECLNTELYLADCPPAGPSERRVLVHASIWEKFMDKFKMYRPILSRIKQEYEMVLHQYSKQLHMLNATQFKVAAENLEQSEQYLEMKNKCLDEIASLRGQLDALTKDKEAESGSIEKIQEKLEHWKQQASTRVPMLKLQMAEAETSELQEALNQEQTSHDMTRQALDKAHTELNKKQQEIEKLQKKMSDMTPRPDWMDISASIPDLAEGFRKCTTSEAHLDQMESMLKKSTDAVKKIQKKKGGGKSAKSKPGAFDYFTGFGTGKDVPEFLKTNGRVRNNHLSKGACEDLVKECWEKKEEYDEGQAKKIKLNVFFPIFLTDKFGKEQVVEQAYNMWFSLKDYSYDADCDLFYRILQGKMDEEVYTDQMQMLDALKAKFQETDESVNGGTATGKINKDILKTVFQEFFPVKSDKEIKECFKQLDKEYVTDMIEYDLIFAEDEEGNQGDFIEGVRDQHLSDREEYIESIEEALWDQDEEDCGEITVAQVLDAFLTFDPEKPPEEVNEVIARSLDMPVKQLKPSKVVAIPAFLKTVQGMSVHRRTKKQD